jgi:pimeloyl-ACP methyl ester carboxylesterase
MTGLFKSRSPRQWIRIILLFFLGIFILMNIVSFLHAWNFTHFTTATERTPPPEELSGWEKVKVLATGVTLPRPVNFTVPEVPYINTYLPMDNDTIALWEIEVPEKKGTIAMFHGYFANRTALLEQAGLFRRLGYSTVLVDFRGSGESSGASTSIGYHEMHEVKRVYTYLKNKADGPVILFGTSMGASAILHAVSKQDIHPDGIILECPFGSLYEATVNRFNTMGVPEFPLAGMLVFWGGVQNGYWGFGHNPSDYARDVTCPTLIYYGELDPRVTREETDAIYVNLRGKKKLVSFSEGGHGLFLEDYEEEWIREAYEFLEDIPPVMVSYTP